MTLRIGPAASALAEADEAGAGRQLRPFAVERLRAALAAHDQGGGIALPGAIWLVEAARP